jgi:hypothetical protein
MAIIKFDVIYRLVKIYNPGMKQKLFSGTLDSKSFILTAVKKVIGKIKLCNQRSWV